MTVETFAVDVLAAQRLTRLVTEDKITEELRWKAIGRFPDSKLSYFVTCPFCVSVWAGLAVSVARRYRIGRGVLYALALSQGVTYLVEIGQNDDG